MVKPPTGPKSTHQISNLQEINGNPPGTGLLRYLDTVGDGTGNKFATGNYSGNPTEFKIVPLPNQIFRLRQALILIQPVGTLAQYGDSPALANGIKAEVRDGTGMVVDLLDGIPITDNVQWVFLADAALVNFKGAINAITGLFNTFNRTGRPLTLDGGLGHYLAFTLRDDFTGLTHHRFFVTGSIDD